MARSEYIRNKLATLYTQEALFMSFHGSDPDVTGAGELDIPRVSINWIPLGGGRVDAQPVSVLMPAGTSLTHVGFWTAATGGTFVDSVAHVADFSVEGTHRFVPSYTQP